MTSLWRAVHPDHGIVVRSMFMIISNSRPHELPISVFLICISLTALLAASSCTRLTRTGSPSELVRSDTFEMHWCCPSADEAAMRRILGEYEATAAASRPPEIAFFPFRQTNGLVHPLRVVVTDSPSWTAVWKRLTAGQSPPPPTPRADFAADVIIVVSSGLRPSGGYRLSIDSARPQKKETLLFLRETVPGARCGVTFGAVTPTALARLRNVTGLIRFMERSDTTQCGVN
jgi:hypothetical protein